jgi:hypothetical protein
MRYAAQPSESDTTKHSECSAHRCSCRVTRGMIRTTSACGGPRTQACKRLRPRMIIASVFRAFSHRRWRRTTHRRSPAPSRPVRRRVPLHVRGLLQFVQVRVKRRACAKTCERANRHVNLVMGAVGLWAVANARDVQGVGPRKATRIATAGQGCARRAAPHEAIPIGTLPLDGPHGPGDPQWGLRGEGTGATALCGRGQAGGRGGRGEGGGDSPRMKGTAYTPVTGTDVPVTVFRAGSVQLSRPFPSRRPRYGDSA